MTAEERRELAEFKEKIWAAFSGLQKEVSGVVTAIALLTQGLEANTKAVEDVGAGRSVACVEERGRVENALAVANRAELAICSHENAHNDTRKSVVKWLMYGAGSGILISQLFDKATELFR